VQEVLLLIVIALALFYVSRLFTRKPTPVRTAPPPVLTGRLRLAILVTLCWIVGTTMLLKPWEDDPLPFLLIGLAPITLLWGAVWVWFGYKRYRR
jgi:hypothetical protein